MYKAYSNFNFPFTSLIEVWKDIVGYEDQYQVSSFGNVRSKDRTRIARGGCTAPIRGRMRKCKISKAGYMVTNLCKDAIKTHPSVHRLVALAFIPNPTDKPTVNHKDGNKLNNNVTNLEWSTHSEQMQHASDNDLLEVRGEPKFSPVFKQKVFDYFEANEISISKLAKLFDISERTAGRIVKGQPEREYKIPPDKVPEIISLRESGWTLKKISEKFGCGISQIHRITKGMSRNLKYERN